MKSQRYIELDLLRGIAVLAMIAYHLVFDLVYFGIASFAVTEGLWKIFARSIAITFILLVGISLFISKKQRDYNSSYYIHRGLITFACGLGITAVTLFVVPKEFIFFGILHLIGLSIILAPFFFSFHWWNGVIGTILIASGWYINNYFITSYTWLAWFGTPHYSMQTLDWFPFLPWFGVILLGLAIGSIFYPEGKPRWWKNTKNIIVGESQKKKGIAHYLLRPVVWLGQHSLMIYLVHQPLIIGVILATTGKWI